MLNTVRGAPTSRVTVARTLVDRPGRVQAATVLSSNPEEPPSLTERKEIGRVGKVWTGGSPRARGLDYARIAPVN